MPKPVFYPYSDKELICCGWMMIVGGMTPDRSQIVVGSHVRGVALTLTALAIFITQVETTARAAKAGILHDGATITEQGITLWHRNGRWRLHIIDGEYDPSFTLSTSEVETWLADGLDTVKYITEKGWPKDAPHAGKDIPQIYRDAFDDGSEPA